MVWRDGGEIFAMCWAEAMSVACERSGNAGGGSDIEEGGWERRGGVTGFKYLARDILGACWGVPEDG